MRARALKALAGTGGAVLECGVRAAAEEANSVGTEAMLSLSGADFGRAGRLSGAPSARASSAGEAKRSWGSSAMARVTIALSQAGTSLRKSVAEGRGAEQIRKTRSG